MLFLSDSFVPFVFRGSFLPATCCFLLFRSLKTMSFMRRGTGRKKRGGPQEEHIFPSRRHCNKMDALGLVHVVANCMVPCRGSPRESKRQGKVRLMRICQQRRALALRLAFHLHPVHYAAILRRKASERVVWRGAWQEQMSADFATIVHRKCPAEGHSKSSQCFRRKKDSTRRGLLNPDLARTLATSETSPSHPR